MNNEFIQYDSEGHWNFIRKDEIEKEIRLLDCIGSDPLFLKSKAIIGQVDLVDIIQDSNDPFAVPGQNHWIFKNPVLFSKPIEQVIGKLGLWEFEKGV
jgi:hypothetical protein